MTVRLSNRHVTVRDLVRGRVYYQIIGQTIEGTREKVWDQTGHQAFNHIHDQFLGQIRFKIPEALHEHAI